MVAVWRSEQTIHAQDDTLYVTDWQDKKAIFIGSAKDGSIKTRIEGLTLAEGLTVDAGGNIYAAETLPGKIGDLVTGANLSEDREELNRTLPPPRRSRRAPHLARARGFIQRRAGRHSRVKFDTANHTP